MSVSDRQVGPARSDGASDEASLFDAALDDLVASPVAAACPVPVGMTLATPPEASEQGPPAAPRSDAMSRRAPRARLASPARRPRQPVWAGGLLACAAGVLAFLVADQFSGRSEPSRTKPAAASAVAAQPAAPVTRAIEEIGIFDRVLGTNPQLSGTERGTPEPDSATWRVLRMQMAQEQGRWLHIRLARPMSWIERVGAEPSKSIVLDLPEMGAVGDAEVLAIEACPPLKPGAGSVVTGTFAHEVGDTLVTVRLSGGVEPIGVTANHPFWSEDRRAFVPVGWLRPGERVRTKAGTAEIVAVEKRAVKPGEMVYNLEVHGEHVYQVTTSGVLVHNSCADLLKPGGRKIGVPGSGDRIRIVKGGIGEAEDFFLELATKGRGRDITPKGFNGMVVGLEGGGSIRFRPTSTSGPPTIDVIIGGIGIDEIKFIR